MSTRKVLLVVMLLCMGGLVARAEVSVMTSDGMGADTYLSNDNQSETVPGEEGPYYPYTTHGDETEIIGFRQIADSRSRTGYIRFDLTSVDGNMADAFLTLDAAYLKGGAKEVQVYGVLDGPGDYWDEATTSYNTAAGLVPNPPTALGNAAIDENEAVLLGTFTMPAVPDPVVYPVTFSSAPGTLDMTDFLNADTNGMVTLIFIGDNNEGTVAAKEHATFFPPTLTLPDVNGLVARAYDPIPAPYASVSTEVTQVSWTNPDPNNPGESISCDFYFGTTEPNALLPNYGLTLQETGITDGTADIPAEFLPLDPFADYYWAVDVHDSSFPGRIVPGVVWSFNTDNTAPVVDAGEDQYVWVNKATVDADTYLRDETVRGDYDFMDVRGGGVDFAGYLRFDLSAFDASTIQDASLTLTVSGNASRNDTVVNGRFALYGLNAVAGNTPQNWDEGALMDTNAGQEWDSTLPMTTALTNGWITDLDDNVAGITEICEGGAEGDNIIISGAPLIAFLQSRLDDDGLATFILANDDGSDRGFGICTKEHATPAYRPALVITTDTGYSGDAEVTLSGSYTDDDLPAPPAVTYLWEQLSGPETVSIDPNDVASVDIAMGAVGTYEFQLSVDDGDLTGTDTVQVYVGFDSCDAAQNWPDYEPFQADFNSDCVVDLRDFVTIANEWLDCNSLECMPL